MAAATNKPGWPHYTAITFFLTTVILGITTYLSVKDASTKGATLISLGAEKQTSETARRQLDEAVQAMKTAMGALLEQPYDAQNPTNANTVVGLFNQKLAELGGEHRGANGLDTLDKLRTALNTAIADRDNIKATLEKTNAELLALRDQYQKTVDSSEDKYKTAKTDLTTEQTRFKEQVDQKEQEVTELRNDYNQAQTELQQEKDSREAERKKAAEDVQKLIANIERLRRQLLDTTRQSFDEAQGKIVRVDSSTNLVWINLGERDFLRPRISFSVYAKDVPGVARGPQDVKGKIEVTRILDQTTAEARIVDEDFKRPITQGDLIYTPLWKPGRVEVFSIVGLIDLDGDGRSDREALHQIMAVNNAKFDNEINDKGEPVDANGDVLTEEEAGHVSEQTKFLILGDIPDETTLVNDDDKAAARAINKEAKRLQAEAIINGVDIIKLNEFLSYVGFQPKRRLFQAGQEKPFNLQAGRPERPTVSTGQVSGALSTGSRNRPQPQKTSTGVTSGQKK
ncbi:OmpH family outer membrane protein [Planctellipticum variicoloris]|uniref:OmpH family outer membrane protein n=1 Tax=Planctellipticum variicoloris TaxID=3064265 RepID=UPI003013CF5F|nr:OmpH family outer membrane protein [Planctomycetaceae bacterium SH412]